MQLVHLFALAGIIMIASCSKSSEKTPTFKATLISPAPSPYSGTATAKLDGDHLFVNITHNIPTPTTSADGIYDNITGLAVSHWFNKPSPMTVTVQIDASTQSHALASQLEIRLYYGTSPATTGVIKGLLIKQ